MKETILASFFRGELGAPDLAMDIAGSEERPAATRRNIFVEDMDGEFVVTRGMAAALCDAVLRREMEPDAFRLIGFALTTSDKFTWNDDDLLADILYDWSCPEIDFKLSIENVCKFKSWLDGSSRLSRKKAAFERNAWNPHFRSV